MPLAYGSRINLPPLTRKEIGGQYWRSAAQIKAEEEAARAPGWLIALASIFSPITWAQGALETVGNVLDWNDNNIIQQTVNAASKGDIGGLTAGVLQLIPETRAIGMLLYAANSTAHAMIGTSRDEQLSAIPGLILSWAGAGFGPLAKTYGGVRNMGRQFLHIRDVRRTIGDIANSPFNMPGPRNQVNLYRDQALRLKSYKRISPRKTVNDLIHETKTQIKSLDTNARIANDAYYNRIQLDPYMRKLAVENPEQYNLYMELQTSEYQQSFSDLDDFQRKINGKDWSKVKSANISRLAEIHKRVWDFIGTVTNSGMQRIAQGINFLWNNSIKVLVKFMSPLQRFKVFMYIIESVASKTKNFTGRNIGTKLSKLSRAAVGVTYKSLQLIVSPARLAKMAFDKTVEGEGIHKITGEFLEDVKKAKSNIAKAHRVEEQFEKTGGLVFSSDWVLGMKVLATDPTGIMAQFSFKSWETQTKEHPNGKLPVYAKITHEENQNLINAKSKGEWYLDNIATSRGGRKATNFAETGMNEKILMGMSFLPIGLISKVMAIAQLGLKFQQGGLTLPNSNEYWGKFGEGLIEEVKDNGQKYFVHSTFKNGFIRSQARQAIKSGGKLTNVFGKMENMQFNRNRSQAMSGHSQLIKPLRGFTSIKSKTKAISNVGKVKVTR